MSKTKPAVSAAAVTPDNTGAIQATRALYIGVAGDVKVDMDDGSTVTFTAAPNGVLPISVTRVYVTGTAATNILALW